MDSVSSQSKIEKVERPRICSKCYSTDIVKQGFRKLKKGTKRQRYACKNCHSRFILGENGFSNVISDLKIISESLNLVMSGMSYRNIARHIETVHQVKISHASVNNWIRKYTELIKEYVDTLNPDLSDVWSLDEMVLNVRTTKKTGNGFHDWLWSIIDPKTMPPNKSARSQQCETRNRPSDLNKACLAAKSSLIRTAQTNHEIQADAQDSQD